MVVRRRPLTVERGRKMASNSGTLATLHVHRLLQRKVDQVKKWDAQARKMMAAAEPRHVKAHGAHILLCDAGGVTSTCRQQRLGRGPIGFGSSSPPEVAVTSLHVACRGGGGSILAAVQGRSATSALGRVVTLLV